MRFTVVTLFPEMFASFLDASLLGKAREAGLLDVSFVDPRAFTSDRHRTVDDAPYGGGPGMVMKAEPLLAALRSAPAPAHRVLLAPTGAPLSQRRVRELAAKDHVLLVCGRYEGIDARVGKLIDEEISIGDFVLSGGEPAAMVLIDAVSRYVPGVLGEAASVEEESFSDGLLEYPQYTRPAEVEGEAVPPVLQGGNHEAIRRWRRAQSLARTAERRPELLARPLPAEDAALLAEQGLPALARRTYVALLHHPVLDRDGQVVTTSVTNLDVHDIARSAATFGLAGYFLATPIAPQREMVEGIVANWQGGARHEARGSALERVHPVAGLDEAVARIAEAHGGVQPHIVTTSARRREDVPVVAPAVLRAERCRDGKRPLLLVFGTGHGLADAVMSQSDQVLAPIEGASGFNHLSVRGAAAILLDRLFGFRIA